MNHLSRSSSSCSINHPVFFIAECRLQKREKSVSFSEEEKKSHIEITRSFQCTVINK